MEAINAAYTDSLQSTVLKLSKLEKELLVIATKESKGKLGFADTQQQQFNLAEVKKLNQERSFLERVLKWIRESLSYKGPLGPASAADAVKGIKAHDQGDFVPIPYLVEAQRGVKVLIRTNSKEWPDEVKASFLKSYDRLRAEEKHKVFILAPEESLSAEGEVLPLPNNVVERLRAGGRSDSDRSWQWLIISHNVNVAKSKKGIRVKIHRDLLVGSSDPTRVGRKDAANEKIRELQNANRILMDQLKQAELGVSHRPPELFSPTPEEIALEEVNYPATLPYGKGLTRMSVAEYLSIAATHTCVRQVLLIGDFLYVSEPEVEIDYDELDSYFEEDTIPSPVVDSSGNGKGADPSNLTKTSSSERKTVSRSEKKAQGAPAPAPKPPGSKGNPLRVKGVPRTRGLTEAQKGDLRKFFKLDELPVITPEEWSAMDKVSRGETSRQRSLPKWAVTAVIQSPDNLLKIVNGELVKESMSSPGKRPKPLISFEKQAEATVAWVALKKRYKGVPLLSRPQTKREKDLKSEFQKLKSTYGKLPCFPRPKERANSPGGDRQKGGRKGKKDRESRSGSSVLHKILDLLAGK